MDDLNEEEVKGVTDADNDPESATDVDNDPESVVDVDNNPESVTNVDNNPESDANEASEPEEVINEVPEVVVPKYSPLMQPDKNNTKKGALFVVCIGLIAILALSICLLLLRDRAKENKETLINEETLKNEVTIDNNTGDDTLTADGSAGTDVVDQTNPDAVVTEAVSYPEVDVTLGEYKGLSVTLLPVEVSDEDVQAELEYLLSSSQAVETITERSDVQSGDVATIDYVGSVDGVEFEGGSAESYPLTIGSGSFIPGFEDQIIGHNVGENFDITVTFPEDYTSTELAGKEAIFNVTVQSIGVNAVPEATDEFIAANTEYSTLDEFNTGTYDSLLATAQDYSNTQKEIDLITTAIANSEFNNLSDEEIENQEAEMIAYYESYASSNGLDLATFVYYYFGIDEATFYTEIANEAELQIKQKYLLNKIIEVENLKLTDLDYTIGLEELATANGFETGEALETQYGREAIEESLVLEKAFDLIVSSAVIITE